MRYLLALFLIILAPASHAAEPLIRLEGCTLVPTEWADGDSFLIRTTEGKEHTIRLYGADCIEWHVTDESDARGDGKYKRFYGFVTTSKGEVWQRASSASV